MNLIIELYKKYSVKPLGLEYRAFERLFIWGSAYHEQQNKS